MFRQTNKEQTVISDFPFSNIYSFFLDFYDQKLSFCWLANIVFSFVFVVSFLPVILSQQYRSGLHFIN